MCAKYKLLPKILELTADQTPSRRLWQTGNKWYLFQFETTECDFCFFFFFFFFLEAVRLRGNIDQPSPLEKKKKQQGEKKGKREGKKTESPWFAPTQHASVGPWKMPNQYSYAEESSGSQISRERNWNETKDGTEYLTRINPLPRSNQTLSL